MIRRAVPDESATLTRIALEAKRYWGYPEHWIKHWESDLTVLPEFISHNQVYVAEQAGEIQGFYSLCINHTKAELEHLWVAPAHIGTGVGKELFLHAMENATSMSVREVQISSDPNAAGFYERMGARKVGEVDSEIDGQPRKLPRMSIDPS
jgi:GNAT superfamily N-acetyltransferase